MNRPSLLGALVAIALVILPAPPAAQEGKKLKVAGTVVDAACFMMHPDAAMLPSHKDCGEACLARGVPLAIINEADGQMYFAADGNGRLTRFHQKRVSAEGIAVRKKDPLELKMPVDDGKEMTVTVRGGYNVLTIQSLAEAPRKWALFLAEAEPVAVSHAPLTLDLPGGGAENPARLDGITDVPVLPRPALG